MSTGIIIQARNSSSRLPSKLIIPFYKNSGILEILLAKISSSLPKVPIVLATTKNSADEPLVEIAEGMGIDTFRGSESDVLDRFIQTGKEYDFQKIIRICSDNPFLDISALEYMVAQMEETEYDYWCYSTAEMLPTIKTHYGFWAEGVSSNALSKVSSLTDEVVYREHVTNYIYTHPEHFSIKYNLINASVDRETGIRLTVDTKKDFDLSKQIYDDTLGNGIPHIAKNLVSYIKEHPAWLQSMQEEIRLNSK